MYYLIISRQCPSMQQELATALQGRREIRVILDRRYGQRRVESRPAPTSRPRRKERRRAATQLPD